MPALSGTRTGIASSLVIRMEFPWNRGNLFELIRRRCIHPDRDARESGKTRGSPSRAQ
jgi:hypothetical protein